MTASRREWTDDERARARALKRAGATLESIARDLGRTPRAVGNELHRMRAGGRRPKVSHARNGKKPICDVSSAELAAELRARGWVVRPPDPEPVPRQGGIRQGVRDAVGHLAAVGAPLPRADFHPATLTIMERMRVVSFTDAGDVCLERCTSIDIEDHDIEDHDIIAAIWDGLDGALLLFDGTLPTERHAAHDLVHLGLVRPAGSRWELTELGRKAVGVLELTKRGGVELW